MQNSTHILVVLDELFPVRGAPQVRIGNLLQALPHLRRTAIGGRLAEVKSPEGFILLERPQETSPVAFLRFLIRLGGQAKRVAKEQKPDIILLSVPKYEMLFFALALKRLTPTLILDFRDSLAFLDYGAYLARFLPEVIAQPIGTVLQRVNGWLQRRAIRAADLITVANEGIRRTVNHPSISVVPNGVDTDTFNPSGKEWYRGGRPLRLVYLGNFAEKDLFTCLRPFQGRKDVEVHLIGDGRNRSRVVSSLEGLQVVNHGVVPHDNLPDLLRGMDLGFIFRKEGVDQSIPVCLFEFASMNIPTVCNNTGLMAEFVLKHKLGFVVEGEVHAHEIISRCTSGEVSLSGFDSLHALAVREFSLRASREKFAQLIDTISREPAAAQVA